MVRDAETLMADLVHQNEVDGPLFKLKNDPRVTRVGHILRRFSLDELPQLWNVLRGDMSLVGPRPALPREITSWGPELHQRLRVKPGITGMWQVNGRSNASFEDYARLDLYYVDNWSLLTDLAIIVKTVVAVLRRHGAY
jgi:lipopolysaccharide/colanic/teichoic acid biosynthesis glycosyltransferase